MCHHTISTEGVLAFADAGLVFKQRMCADRHNTHLAHVFGSLQYTLQCVTKDLHSTQAFAKEQWSSVPTTAEPKLVPAVVKASKFRQHDHLGHHVLKAKFGLTQAEMPSGMVLGMYIAPGVLRLYI